MSKQWNYKREYIEGDTLSFYLKHDGCMHGLVFDSPSNVCEHWIEDKRSKEKRGRAVLWDRLFSLIPEPFLGSEPPGIELDTKVLLDEGVYLCYKGVNRQHLFQSVYLTAKEISENVPRLVFFWWHERVVYVLVFLKQQLRFANLFEVKDAAEVVYFVLSAVQECDMHQDEFTIIGDADSNDLQHVDLELEKLGLGMKARTRVSLYADYFNSPYQVLSTYLFQMPQCALPEAY
jgi:hypothetical protein